MGDILLTVQIKKDAKRTPEATNAGQLLNILSITQDI